MVEDIYYKLIIVLMEKMEEVHIITVLLMEMMYNSIIRLSFYTMKIELNTIK